MGNSVRWTEEQLRDHERKQNNDRAAVSVAYLESNSSHAAKSADAGKEGHPRYRIKIHSKRRRLTDSDGVSGKWAVDGLVAGGIIPDDSPEWVESVTFSQELSEHEETILTVEVADD